MGFSGGVFTRTDGTRTGATVCQQQQAATTGIDPVLFDNELNEIVAGLETALLKDGTNAATANINLGGNKITNVANGTSSSDAVNFSQLSTLSPSGSVVMWAGALAPSGWLLCDGSAISRGGYSTLFATIGTTYGAGDGSTTFNLPDLRQRFPLGKAASGLGSALGDTGGAVDHTHSIPAHYHGMGTGADLAATSNGAHTHTVSDPTASGGAFKHFFTTYNGVNADVAGAGTEGTKYDLSSTAIQTASNGAHTHSLSGSIGLVTGGVDGNASMTSGPENPPFLVLNFIIKT